MSFISTNNRAELTGALLALELVKTRQASGEWPVCPVTVVCDSEYVVKGMTERLHRWVAKGWRTSSKEPVKNRDLWECLIGVTETVAAEWRWVRGHSGNVWNERADQLATEASAMAAESGVTFAELDG